jgi:hypothetical protein
MRSATIFAVSAADSVLARLPSEVSAKAIDDRPAPMGSMRGTPLEHDGLTRRRAYLFSPGICWSGFSLNRLGSAVHRLQTSSYGVRPLRVFSRRAKV